MLGETETSPPGALHPPLFVGAITLPRSPRGCRSIQSWRAQGTLPGKHKGKGKPAGVSRAESKFWGTNTRKESWLPSSSPRRPWAYPCAQCGALPAPSILSCASTAPIRPTGLALHGRCLSRVVRRVWGDPFPVLPERLGQSGMGQGRQLGNAWMWVLRSLR